MSVLTTDLCKSELSYRSHLYTTGPLISSVPGSLGVVINFVSVILRAKAAVKQPGGLQGLGLLTSSAWAWLTPLAAVQPMIHSSHARKPHTLQHTRLGEVPSVVAL